MSMKKHFGAIKNTGTRVIVVFRSLPDDPDNCLVVEQNTVPEKYHDAVLNLANSSDAQRPTCNDFYEVLNRNIFSDGKNMLQVLHFNGLLRKVPVDGVVLFPQPGRELPLRMANDAIDGTGTSEISKNLPNTTDIKHQSQESVEPSVSESNEQSYDMGDPTAIAEGLLLEAEMMKATAKRKEEEAFALAPELKPPSTGKPGRPPKSSVQKAATKDAAKNRRNVRERAERSDAKKAKTEQSINKAVEAKVARDTKSQQK